MFGRIAARRMVVVFNPTRPLETCLRLSVPTIFFPSFQDSASNMLNWGINASWLPHFDYLWRVMGIQQLSRLEGIIELAQSCGWWSPYQNVVILQNRPSDIRRIDLPKGDLDLKAPATLNLAEVKFRDGWTARQTVAWPV
jgi:hypothetical protein